MEKLIEFARQLVEEKLKSNSAPHFLALASAATLLIVDAIDRHAERVSPRSPFFSGRP